MKRELIGIYRDLLSKTSGKMILILAAIFCFFLVFADFLANERPLYCVYQNQTYFPVLHEYLEKLNISEHYEIVNQRSWTELNFERAVYPFIRFKPNTLYDGQKTYQKPFTRLENRSGIHYLGTDQIGRDVAAGLIHGTRTAFAIGLASMFLASLFGILMGVVGGYFGDHGIRVNAILGLYSFFVLLLMGFLTNYGNIIQWGAGLIGLAGVGLLIGRLVLMSPSKLLSRKIPIPADLIVMRAIEIFKSIPALILLLAILALIDRPTVYHIIFIIGLFKWPAIARLIRAEMLHIREAEYILAQKALGQSPAKIIWNHALPNAIMPAVVAIAFGISSAVILEATISFLGLGLGAEDVTWGSLLSAARRNFSAWWLAIFPGLAIFFLVYLFNSLGDHFNQAP